MEKALFCSFGHTATSLLKNYPCTMNISTPLKGIAVLA